MKDKLTELWYTLADMMPVGLAVIMWVLIWIIIIGFVIGAHFFIGWIAMLVYNAIVPATFPHFSLLVWTGGIWVLRKIFGLKITIKKHD